MGPVDGLKGCEIEKGSILCIGNALLDLTFFGDEDFLAEHGLRANDACIVPEETFKKMYSALKARYKTEQYLPGGAGQNTARATQWLLSAYPGAVTYLGTIANDSLGAILIERASQAGVTGLYQVITDATHQTGCCLVILNGQNRSLVGHLGASLLFSTDHLRQNWHAVEKARIIYLEGFFLPTCFEACMLIAKHVAQNPHKRLVLNLSSVFVTKKHKEKLVEIIPYADVLIGNDSEAESFAQEMHFDTSELTKIASIFASMEKKRSELKRAVVITRGAKPLILANGSNNVTTYDVVLVKKELVVDTNGAGDAFVAGFLAQLAFSKPYEACVRSGLNMAAIVIQQLGCTFPLDKPALDDLCL